MSCTSCGLSLSVIDAWDFAPCCIVMSCCGQTPWDCADNGLCDVSLSCDLDDADI